MGKGALFFKLQNREKKYTDAYALEKIRGILKNGKEMRIRDLYDVFSSDCGAKVNYSVFRELVENSFPVSRGSAHLEEMTEEADEETRLYCQEKLNRYLAESDQALLFRIMNQTEQTEEAMMSGTAAAIHAERIQMEKAVNRAAEWIRKKEENIERIRSAAEKMHESSLLLDIDAVFQEEQTREILALENIVKAEDLRSLTPEQLYVFFAPFTEENIREMELLDREYLLENVRAVNEWIHSILNERTYDIIMSRNVCDEEEVISLEECGRIYGLTRERIRQIEIRGKEKLKKVPEEIIRRIERICLIVMRSEKEWILSAEQMNAVLQDQEIFRNIALLLSVVSSRFRYSESLNAIYNSQFIDEESYRQSVIERYGNFIGKRDFENAAGLEKKILMRNYKPSRRGNHLYILEGLYLSDVIGEIIHESFPNGYHIYDEKDYLRFREFYGEKYGSDFEMPSSDSLRGLIGRQRFTQVDKGCYKLASDCTVLPDELILKIQNYIFSNQPVVFYATIFEAFQEELREYGVDNYFYLKGLIDPTLPKDFRTKRNYIQTEGSGISGKAARINTMRSFEGSFTFSELKDRFSGVQDYVFLFDIDDENDHGLVPLSGMRYIYLDHLKISEEEKEKLRLLLEQQFEKSESSDVITSRKVYSLLLSKYPEFTENHPDIDGQFPLFSLIRALFPDYYYRRPYISKRDRSSLNKMGLINEYIQKEDSVSWTDLKQYCERMNIPLTMGFFTVADMISASHVQADVDRFEKKEKLKLTDRAVRKIDAALRMYFSTEDVINTETFQGYTLFPELKHPWNKYLLAGVVRSCLSEYYTIEPTEPVYGAADFIIREIRIVK